MKLKKSLSGILTLVFLLNIGARAQSIDRILETWNSVGSSLVSGLLSNPQSNKTIAAADFAVVKFKPVGDSGAARSLADAFGRSANEKAALIEAFGQIQGAYEAEVAKEGKSNNLAAALTFFIAANIAAYHQTELPSDEASENLFESLQKMISGVPEFARLSDAEKQKMHDWLVCMGGFTMTGYFEARKSGDREGLRVYRELADYSLRLVLGVEAGKLSFKNNNLLNEETNNSGVAGQNQPIPSGAASGISIATTNFDDGWTATIHNEYVLVAKGETSVYLFYGVNFNNESRNNTGAYFWNSVVVPRFNVRSARHWESQTADYYKPDFVEGGAIDKQTGKSCYLGMNVISAAVGDGVAKVVLVAAPDQQTYYNQFPHPSDLIKMLSYNRFAVTAKALVGQWKGDNRLALDTYNIYTGANQGMYTSAGSQEFTFNSNGKYFSRLVGASGKVGATSFFDEKYNGSFSATNWEVTITGFAGKTTVFKASFEAVRNSRILHLTPKNAAGINYVLAKIS